MSTLTVVNWNYERDGKGDRAQRTAGYERLASLNPDLVLRQEMWGADADGKTIMYDSERVLGMRGWLGERACTAIFANPDVFAAVREWPETGPMWVLPPTALMMRYAPAGEAALPLAVVAYHLNYASTTNRLAEVEWLSTWADRKWETSDGRVIALPAFFGGDNNSFPDEDLPEAPALPDRKTFKDHPHRLHRSHPDSSGDRKMDTRPDAALREAGMVDVARYWATSTGDEAAVARTVNACATHGPDSRIDRAYTTPQLLPALKGVDVIEVPEHVSDHHMLRIKLDGSVLADILNELAVAA